MQIKRQLKPWHKLSEAIAVHMGGATSRLLREDVNAEVALRKEPPHFHRLALCARVERGADGIGVQPVAARRLTPHEWAKTLPLLVFLLRVAESAR